MFYSNEIVFRGHPDKVCDQIGDALLTKYLRGDPNSRCGIEVTGGKGKIFITGEVTSNTKVNVKKVVKDVLRDIGYSTKYKIIDNIGKQSPDIAQGVDVGGAGDQGMMFGFACRDTKQFVPTAMAILQLFSQEYDKLVHNETDIYTQLIRNYNGKFLPDGKAQITGCYDENMKLQYISDFTISYQNTETDRESMDQILKDLAYACCKQYGVERVDNFHINPTGKFLIGGFEGDAGVLGRKIVVDAYQSFANVGGGAQSGKDPTKVDRSAAYKARQIAVRTLNSHPEVDRCEVQISYSIGMEKPMAIYIKTNKGLIEPTLDLYEECTPKRIIDDLNLTMENYYHTAQYGHYGLGFDWDRE